MSDEPAPKDFEGEKVCSWCGARFRQEWPQSWPVCLRCHRLLADAGIKDEEIFGEAKSGEDDGRGKG